MYTRHELKTKLLLMTMGAMETDDGRVFTVDKFPDLALVPLVIQDRPVTTVILMVRVGDYTVTEAGTSICQEGDTWDPWIGQWIAVEKALENLVEKYFNHNARSQIRVSKHIKRILAAIEIGLLCGNEDTT